MTEWQYLETAVDIISHMYIFFFLNIYSSGNKFVNTFKVQHCSLFDSLYT